MGSVLRFDHIEGLFKLGGIRQQTLQDGGIACDLDQTRLLTRHPSIQLQPPTGNGRLRIRAVLALLGQQHAVVEGEIVLLILSRYG